METYSAFGLSISSELPLPELTLGAVKPDVHIRIGRIETENPAIHNSSDSYLATTDFGRLLVSKGGDIILEPVDGADEGELRAIILGPALAFMLRLRGYFALHASSIALDQEAIAFVGNSGWGKSTLAKAFHDQGFPIVTDDILAVTMEGCRPMIVPSFPLLKLWPDSATALGADLTQFSKMHAKTEKLIHRFTQGFHDTLLPLKCIYFLGKGDQITINELTQQEALANLIVNTWGTISLKTRQLAHVHLQQCAHLIKEVPMFGLKRPSDLNLLPQIVHQIIADLASK